MKLAINSHVILLVLCTSISVGGCKSEAPHPPESSKTPRQATLPKVSLRPSLELTQLTPLTNFELRSLLTVSREDLFERGSQSLLNVIASLRANGRIDSWNKANLFEQGLFRAETAISGSRLNGGNIHEEAVSILTSGGLPNSHLLSVGGISRPRIDSTLNWMNYSDTQSIQQISEQGFQITFANFANHRLGGGWNRHGNVQEEQMAQQCPDFAVILSAFNSEQNQTQIHTRRNPTTPTDQEGAKYSHGDGNTSDPKLITNLRCFQKLTDTYEHQTRLIYQMRWNDLSQVLEDRGNAPSINMIAMAAPELRQTERGIHYSIGLLRDFFDNAFTAFSMVKAYDLQHGRHTYLVLGRWGAGAFGHNLNMSLAIQTFAAKLVLEDTDRILFTGLAPGEQIPEHEVFSHILTGAIDNPSSITSGSIQVDNIFNIFLGAYNSRLNWQTRP